MPREKVQPVVPNESCTLGWNVHNVTAAKITEIDQALEDCYTWVSEVLIEVKKAMAS